MRIHTHNLRGISKHWRNLIAVTLFVLIVTASPSLAQSTDRDNPTPFPSSEIKGQSPATKIMFYYSFAAGPGELKVTLDSTNTAANEGTFGAGIELFDLDAEQIGGTIGPAYLTGGENDREVKRFQLKSKQPIIMRLTLRPHLTYMVRLEGAVDLSASTATPDDSSSTAAGKGTLSVDTGKDASGVSSATPTDSSATSSAKVSLGAHTPPAGSLERKAILDAYRAVWKGEDENAISDVVFVVNNLKVDKEWAWLDVNPQSSDGSQQYEGEQALLYKKHGRWVVMDRTAGADGDYFKKLKIKFPSVPFDIFLK